MTSAAPAPDLEYFLQTSETRDRVWVHCSDGSTVARFGLAGLDLHNSVTEQMQGKPECRLCTHGWVNQQDWALFRERVLDWWNVAIPENAIDPKHFQRRRALRD